MGGMFDDVSDRYDFLNRVLSLGQDRAWRAEMWRQVPDDARVVLDLCTGSGVSLDGLRRPGRRVLGIDASLGMLQIAASHSERSGWAPRLACADAFRLPLRAGALDAITVAFGVRNLRPRLEALREIARVLKPGGTLVVLEAVAPAGGLFAPAHRFYLRHVVPLAGRLSRDPSAYAYLASSIVEFGAGEEFEHDLESASFTVTGRQSFLAGATRLWVSRSPRVAGQNTANVPGIVHNARPDRANRGNLPNRSAALAREWRVWTTVQLVLSAALTIALAYGFWIAFKFGDDLPLPAPHRPIARLLLGGGAMAFGLRSGFLLLRLMGPPGRS
ncbi:MAG TPA: ubiquinone/menaquinone biosynthesis methyltransferase [Candidatus Limnocylindria bacterium]|nr:ubiquinone/menaquinone biosynthesis methyltransferase [Candidatus Limnocylindria bacterium]